MTAKHTPGPFFVTQSSDWGGMSGVSLGIDDAFGMEGGRDYHLATVVHGDPDAMRANARLIAAAPEMLEALQFMLTEFEHGDINAGEEAAISKARTAIAKATGDTP